MCTVTYVPMSSGGFILTSSRDENIVRPAALMPQAYDIFNQQLFFPKDPKAGGTWIAVGEKKMACLLNGAFKKHTPKPPYKKSRGLVVLDYFAYDTAHSFVSQYDFNSIEPFTLILIDGTIISELRWDGKRVFHTEKNPSATHIWSSATLYSDEVIEKRKLWFNKWVKKDEFATIHSMVDFHLKAGEGDIKNDLLMNRGNGMQTISITSVEYNLTNYIMKHRDLLSNTDVEIPLIVLN